MDKMFKNIARFNKKLLISDLIGIGDLIKSLKSNKKSLFKIEVCESSPREYLEITDKDVELFTKYNPLYNEKSMKREIKKFKEKGKIYYGHFYGNKWQLINDSEIKLVALGL